MPPTPRPLPWRSTRSPTSADLHWLFDGSTKDVNFWQGDWNQYAAWLFSLALRRHVQASDAEDAVQEVLAALPGFRRFRRDHPGAPLRRWMVSVLLHKISDQHRERARRPEALPDERLSEVPESKAWDLDPAWHGEEPSAFTPIVDRVKRRVAEPNNWRAFQGVVLEGKAAAEVAAELGMNVAQVHTAKSRVLRRLREEVGTAAAPLRHEFDETTWALFLEVAVEGRPAGLVARNQDLSEHQINLAVSRVLRRLREAQRTGSS